MRLFFVRRFTFLQKGISVFLLPLAGDKRTKIVPKRRKKPEEKKIKALVNFCFRVAMMLAPAMKRQTESRYR